MSEGKPKRGRGRPVSPEKAKRVLDRADMIRLKRRGWTETMLSEKFDLTVGEVEMEIKYALRHVKRDMSKDAKILFHEKLEELAEVKKEAWQEWERSKEDSTRHVEESTSGGMGGDKSRVLDQEEGRLGDPRYLNTIVEVIKKECELHGLNPARELNVSGTMKFWDVLASGEIPDVSQIRGVEDEIRLALEQALHPQESLPAPPETIYVEPEERSHE